MLDLAELSQPQQIACLVAELALLGGLFWVWQRSKQARLTFRQTSAEKLQGLKAMRKSARQASLEIAEAAPQAKLWLRQLEAGQVKKRLLLMGIAAFAPLAKPVLPKS
jgi:hypothetical protein